jgi:hypothetical protein
MLGRQAAGRLLSAVVLLTALAACPAVGAADKDKPKDGGTVKGVVIDKRDNWLTVRADGEEESVKYVLGDSPNRAVSQAFNGIFTLTRVELVYKPHGDARQLVSLRKAPGRPTGTVTGVVVVTNDWWLLVKPKNAPLDGFAAMAPTAAYKPVLEKIRSCQKGDVVTIRYYTDFERHRIQSIRKVVTEKK